jgi:hypothetical protein
LGLETLDYGGPFFQLRNIISKWLMMTRLPILLNFEYTYSFMKFVWMRKDKPVNTCYCRHQYNNISMRFMYGYSTKNCCILEMELDL